MALTAGRLTPSCPSSSSESVPPTTARRRTPAPGPPSTPSTRCALARAHEDSGWDRVLTAYGSGSADPAQAAALIACRTERLQLLLAHRPNVAYPTFTAKTVATLDQISRRPPDRCTSSPAATTTSSSARATRCPRTAATTAPARRSRSSSGLDRARALRLPRRALLVRRLRARRRARAAAPAADLLRRLLPRRLQGRARRRPTSTALWGEPLAEHRRADRHGQPQLARRPAARRRCSRWRSGRSSARTEEQAWEKAYAIVAAIEDRTQASGAALTRRHPLNGRRRTPARSGCWPSRSRASGSTGRCGRSPPRPPGARATPPRWSARPRPSPPP